MENRISGAVAGTTKITGTVSATSEPGVTGALLADQTSEVNLSNGPAPGLTTVKSKTVHSLNGMIINLHRIDAETSGSLMGLDFVTLSKITANPPQRDPRYTLKAGESATVSWTQTGTTSGTAAGQPIPATTATASPSFTVTYKGQETVTVPAGTFTACRFEVKNSGDPNAVYGSTTEWIAKGSGIGVRSEGKSSSGAVTVTELVRSSL